MINLEDVNDMRSNTDANYGDIHNAIIQSMNDFPLSWTVESNDMFGEYGVNTFALNKVRVKHMEIVLVHKKAKMGLRLGVTARRSFFMRRERYDFESRFLPRAPAMSNAQIIYSCYGSPRFSLPIAEAVRCVFINQTIKKNLLATLEWKERLNGAGIPVSMKDASDDEKPSSAPSKSSDRIRRADETWENYAKRMAKPDCEHCKGIGYNPYDAEKDFGTVYGCVCWRFG